MKQIITLLVAVLISTASFAQKSELKTAEKAIKANNFTEAISVLNSAKGLIKDAKDKYKTKYYYLLGKALYANGTTPQNNEKAAQAFSTLIDLEKSGSKKYTNEVSGLINTMVSNVAKKASALYNEGVALSKNPETKEASKEKFKKAAKNFEEVYLLSKADTAFVQNAGLAYYFAGDYQNSIESYQKLLDLGYSGASTSYTAKSVVSGQRVSYKTKKEMDNQVKLKLATDPKVEKRPSQRSAIIKMIAKDYIALNNNEKALEFIHKAQQDNPDDYGLLVDEANVYFAMGDKLKFKEKLEKAVTINPTDPMLYYNIGVMKMDMKDSDGAIASFKKAIELKPDYRDAYNNIGAAILAKAEPIVEEMNKNLTNFAKYDQLQAQQLEVYREALPYYEKVYQMGGNDINTVQTLMGIYENLEMTDKAKEMRAVYNKLRQ